jgi:hypothetical protein
LKGISATRSTTEHSKKATPPKLETKKMIINLITKVFSPSSFLFPSMRIATLAWLQAILWLTVAVAALPAALQKRAPQVNPDSVIAYPTR